MITKKQLDKLASDFGIDNITIAREYLQMIFLNYLYKEKISERIYFKGGTCLHFLYNSPRFSEDLDFSTNLTKKESEKLLKKIITSIRKEIPEIKLIFIYSGRKSLRYKIKYEGPEFKYPLTIRIDFSFEKIILKPSILKIETKFPVAFSPLILPLKEEEILTEKIRAFLTRAKGRDVFDLWHLFSKNLPLRTDILDKKLKQVNLTFSKESFLEKIKKYPSRKLELDLARFLPKHYRKIIPKLKEQLLEQLEKALK